MHLWENHAPADKVVKSELWLLAAFATGIAGERLQLLTIFDAIACADRLAGQLRSRYTRSRRMFEAYARSDAAENQRRIAAQSVSRLAAEGHRGMLELHRQIVDRNLSSDSLPAAVQQHIITTAELMDVSAAFGLQAESPDEDLQARCKLDRAKVCLSCARTPIQSGTSLER